jgi:hypothetical protein
MHPSYHTRVLIHSRHSLASRAVVVASDGRFATVNLPDGDQWIEVAGIAER